MPPHTTFTWEAGVAVAVVLVWNIALYLFNSSSVLWRKCGGRVSLVLVSNRSRAVHKQQQPQTWFAWDLISSKDVVNGVVGMPALTLFRAFEVVVFLLTVIYGNALYEPAGGAFFIYFTNWTFVLFGLTGVMGSVLTAKEWARSRRPTIPCVGEEPRKPPPVAVGWSRPLRAYHLLLTVTCSASVMLTIFYWLADYVPGEPLRFDNPVKHGASALLLLLDVALSSVPAVSFHLQVVVAYGSLYLAFLWLYYAGTGTWVYRALDWTRPMSAGFYAALPLLLAVGFLAMAVVACLRELAMRTPCCRRCCLGEEQHHCDEDLLTAQHHAAKGGPHYVWHGAGKGPAASSAALAPHAPVPPSPRLAISLGSG